VALSVSSVTKIVIVEVLRIRGCRRFPPFSPSFFLCYEEGYCEAWDIFGLFPFFSPLFFPFNSLAFPHKILARVIVRSQRSPLFSPSKRRGVIDRPSSFSLSSLPRWPVCRLCWSQVKDVGVMKRGRFFERFSLR